MSEILVRRAYPGEYAAIGDLVVDAYGADGFLGSEPGARYATTLRDAADRAEHAELLAAVDDGGTVLGSVTVTEPGTPYAELAEAGELEFRMLGTLPAARGRGVGEAMIRAVIDTARERGCTRVVLCSLDRMTTAHRLYQRLGFTRLPERDWEVVAGVPLLAFGVEL